MIDLPILEFGAVIGALHAERPAWRRAFDSREIAGLRAVAAGLGEALEAAARQERLDDRHRQVLARLEHLQQDNLDLARASDAKSVFLATTSHEFRAPLTALLAETELLDHLLPQEEGEDRCRRLVHGARTNARQLLRLVDDLMDLARIEGGQLELRDEVVDLGEVAADVVTALLPSLEQQQLTLALVNDGPAARLSGDAGRLWQVIVNLVTNAANATPPGGHVRVEVSVVDGRPQVEVRDTGVGIAPEALERIFAPFEQGPDQHRGLGLGLTIARHLAEAHGGDLRATSTPGRGSRFTARFDPIVDGRPGSDEMPARFSTLPDRRSPAASSQEASPDRGQPPARR